MSERLLATMGGGEAALEFDGGRLERTSDGGIKLYLDSGRFTSSGSILWVLTEVDAQDAAANADLDELDALELEYIRRNFCPPDWTEQLLQLIQMARAERERGEL